MVEEASMRFLNLPDWPRWVMVVCPHCNNPGYVTPSYAFSKGPNWKCAVCWNGFYVDIGAVRDERSRRKMAQS